MRDDWRRLLCRLRWHTFEWHYSDDHSARWRACHYCGRDRAAAGVWPLIG